MPNITTRCVDIRKLRSGVKYDSIYAHLSLHYFTNEETERVFARLRAMLKPGGLLFVKCKSTDDMLYGRGKRVEEDMYLYKGHVRRFFSKGYMREKLRNFSSVRIRKTSSTYHTYKSSFVEAIAAR